MKKLYLLLILCVLFVSCNNNVPTTPYDSLFSITDKYVNKFENEPHYKQVHDLTLKSSDKVYSVTVSERLIKISLLNSSEDIDIYDVYFALLMRYSSKEYAEVSVFNKVININCSSNYSLDPDVDEFLQTYPLLNEMIECILELKNESNWFLDENSFRFFYKSVIEDSKIVTITFGFEPDYDTEQLEYILSGFKRVYLDTNKIKTLDSETTDKRYDLKSKSCIVTMTL